MSMVRNKDFNRHDRSARYRTARAIAVFWSCYVAVIAVVYSSVANSGEVRHAAPIQVDKAEMRSLSLVELVLRPDYTSDVQVASDKLLEVIALEIKKVGYNVKGAADEGVFEKNKGKKSEMMLAGTINHLECEDRIRFRYLVACDVAVAWELYDNRQEKVVYKALTRHRREISTNHDVVDSEVNQLLFGALRSLLARKRFVAAMKKIDTKEFDEPKYLLKTFQVCDGKKYKLPKQMDDVMDASVLVRAGNAVGSGFYISPDGLLLTANHVVEGINKVVVKDRRGAKFDAVVLRRDRKRDIALLKVQIATNRCLLLRDDIPVTGEELYGIGAPGGEEMAFSVTRGIVSGIREWESHRFIQTDASLNDGNSGGPLLDKRGQVIGIVSWKVKLPGFEGLGFGVPADTALEALAIAPGTETTLASMSEAEQEAEEKSNTDVQDRDDPTFAELHVEPTSVEKYRIYTFKEKKLYNGWRGAFLTTGPVLFVTGSIMALVSWNKFKNEAGYGGVFPKAPESYEMDDSKPMNQSRIDALKGINTAGWVIAGVGLATTIAFFATGKSRESLDLEAEAAENNGQADAGGGFEIRIGVAGPGILLKGRF